MTESNEGGVRVEREVRRVLHLTLKKKWFDMIASGEKREEYREMKPYWSKRLMGHKFDAIQFRNGYTPESPTVLVEVRELLSGLGIPEWGAPAEKEVFILRLGKILSA